MLSPIGRLLGCLCGETILDADRAVILVETVRMLHRRKPASRHRDKCSPPVRQAFGPDPNVIRTSDFTATTSATGVCHAKSPSVTATMRSKNFGTFSQRKEFTEHETGQ